MLTVLCRKFLCNEFTLLATGISMQRCNTLSILCNHTNKIKKFFGGTQSIFLVHANSYISINNELIDMILDSGSPAPTCIRLLRKTSANCQDHDAHSLMAQSRPMVLHQKYEVMRYAR